MTDDDESTNVMNRSGGADLNAEGDVNVGGDVVGRDKNVTYVTINNYLAISPPERAQVGDARTAYLRALVDLAKDISEMADAALRENQDAIYPFLEDSANYPLTRKALLELFHKQRQRGKNRQRLKLVEASYRSETEPELQGILEDFYFAVSSLYNTFYSHEGADPRFYKRTMVDTFEKLDGEKRDVTLKEECELYLENLRGIIERISDGVVILAIYSEKGSL